MTNRNTARTQPCLSASGKVCYSTPAPEAEWVVESADLATLTNGVESFKVVMNDDNGSEFDDSPRATPSYVNPGDAPAVAVATNGADRASIILSRAGGFPDSGPYSVYVYDIEDSGVPPHEAVTWAPAPDFIGPVGNGVVTEYRWDDASVMGNQIYGYFGTVGIVGQKVTELIVGFTEPAVREAWAFHDCDDPRTPIYFDVLTGDALTDPTLTDCSDAGFGGGAGSTAVAAHMQQIITGAGWTPSDIPPGTLVGLSVSVTSGTVGLVDADSNSSLMPTGYSASWAAEPGGELIPPTAINPSLSGGQGIVTMSVRV